MTSRPSDPNKLAACRTDLGPLTRKLLQQQQEIERLRAERDEARRRYCRDYSINNPKHDDMTFEEAAMEVASSLGWDCFKEGAA